MEAELKCPGCSKYYSGPLILPCQHTVCSPCALRLQTPYRGERDSAIAALERLLSSSCSSGSIGTLNRRCSSSTSASGSSTAVGVVGGGFAMGAPASAGVVASPSAASFLDIALDKISLYSEADSGVGSSLGGTSSSSSSSSSSCSRPCSSAYGGSVMNLPTAASTACSPPSTVQPSEALYSVVCPCCRKIALLEADGVAGLPHNRVVESILDKLAAASASASGPAAAAATCQSCDAASAAVACDECESLLCTACSDARHTDGAPHRLSPAAADGRAALRQKARARDARCRRHPDETLTMYCAAPCHCAVCYLCVQQGRHLNHDVQALGSVSKHRKAELTHTIQSLSAKAKVGSAFVQQLKAMVDQVEESSKTCELLVTECCDALLEQLQRKRLELLQVVARDREQRIAALKEQVVHSSAHLQKTTGLLQFSVEALKEQDSVAFMQVCDGLYQRACMADANYHKEMETRPRVSPNFCVALDNRAALHEIDTMNFFQVRAPSSPSFVPEECSAHNNKVTLVWQPTGGSTVDAYVLELDDGAGGSFREVYCGPETVCHVDGLHFDSVYTARVRCCNPQGESMPSECLRLKTSSVAWFNFERERHGDIVLSEDKLTATCSNFDDRVVLGTIGFSRGIHYWEYRIDRYDNHPDPAFGVARRNCCKDMQLGKDELSWSMYADDQRSWFMHGAEHVERADGGVSKGCVVGVRLDLNAGELSYYINGRRHGPCVAFSGLQGVFFPAVSLNRNVQVTLRTGLVPPLQHDDARH